MDDGSTWTWAGDTEFFFYKHFLEGQDIRPLLRESRADGANLVRVCGMSRWMDGGETDATQFWPQHHGDVFYDRIPEFGELCADEGLNFEFSVFFDARDIMPDAADQQRHLDRVTAKLRDLPNAFMEIENEHSVNKGVDLSRIKPTDPGDLLWATGDYDMERIDLPGQPDPRPPMPIGRYVTYHGKRTYDGSLIEAAKEGHYYEKGWDSTEHGKRSYAKANNCPCINDEPMGAWEALGNRWGDERYIDPNHAMVMGAGHALSSAGGTFHHESGCLSRPLTDTERKCRRAYFAGMRFISPDVSTWPYEHDRTGSHVLNDIPHLGEGEAVSRANGDHAEAVSVLIKDGYVPEGRDGWRVVERVVAGDFGHLMKLSR